MKYTRPFITPLMWLPNLRHIWYMALEVAPKSEVCWGEVCFMPYDMLWVGMCCQNWRKWLSQMESMLNSNDEKCIPLMYVHLIHHLEWPYCNHKLLHVYVHSFPHDWDSARFHNVVSISFLGAVIWIAEVIFLYALHSCTQALFDIHNW